MRKMIVAGLFGWCVGAATAQELTVQGVLDVQSAASSGEFTGRSEWVAMNYYLQGVIEGIGTYQGALAESDETTVFCPPRGKGYSIEELLPALRTVPDSQKSRPAREVILEHYASRYRCKE